MAIANTIAPIFILIFLGAVLRRFGLLPAPFLFPANQLVYHVAIPAMLFQDVAQADIATQFHPAVILGTLLPLLLIMIPVHPLIGRLKLTRGRGTFMQASYHGNLGYIGLAVAFYYLGDDGLTKASIIGGFLMLLQNIQSVAAYSLAQAGTGPEARTSGYGWGQWLKKLLIHPIIIAIMAGLVFSLAGLKLPLVLDRSFKILGGMSLPLALLLIGASLSWKQAQGQAWPAVLATGLKLLILPGLGLLLYLALGLEKSDYLPGLILLAAPSATLTYVMSQEMGGDTNLASACIALSTLLSALSYSLWLIVAG